MIGFRMRTIDTEEHVCKVHCDLYNHDTASCPPKAREMCQIFDMRSGHTWHYFEKVKDE